MTKSATDSCDPYLILDKWILVCLSSWLAMNWLTNLSAKSWKQETIFGAKPLNQGSGEELVIRRVVHVLVIHLCLIHP